NVPSTGGSEIWKTVRIGPESLTAGTHNLALLFGGGGYNLNWLKFTSLSVALGTYQVYQNYPNPFNPTTTIEYDLPRDGFVSVEIFDMLGRKTAVIDQGFVSAGRRNAVLHAETLHISSGVYFYRIDLAGTKSNVRKLMLIK
ncbi:MAG TPA: T9SS type A sorting domain-containing protein, partial [Bacteroidota bacterium]